MALFSSWNLKGVASWNIPCIAPDFPAIDSINIPGVMKGGDEREKALEYRKPPRDE